MNETSILSLVNSSGLILAATKNTNTGKSMPSNMLAGITNQNQPWLSGTDLANHKVIYSSAPTANTLDKNMRVNTLDWKVTAHEEKSTALAKLQALLRTLTIVTIIAIVIICAFGYWLTNLFKRPITNLTQTASGLLKGDFRLRASSSGIYEFNLLAQTFNEMTGELVRSQADLAASIHGLTQGFIMADKDGSILTINEAGLELLGFSDGEKPATIHDALHNLENFDSRATFERFIQDVQARKGLLIKDVASGGSFFNLQFSPIIIETQTVGAVVQVINITEQRILQRSRDEFFSIASHELRTPLTTIRGNSSMMLEVYAEDLKNPDLKQMLGDIHKSSKQLVEIVNDFLDVSRIEQGKISYNLEAVKLDAIVSSVVKEMEAIVKGKNIKLEANAKELSSLPEVIGDEGRIKQIVYNLVGNAVKFTEKGSVKIGAGLADNTVTISVSDTGRGIPVENQKLLFHKFQQASNSILTRDTQRGTGLGLYISKLLAEGMGGNVELVSSVPDQGSTFAFSLLVSTNEQLEALKAKKPLVIDSTTGMSKTEE